MVETIPNAIRPKCKKSFLVKTTFGEDLPTVENCTNYGYKKINFFIKTTIFHSSVMGGICGICCAQKPPMMSGIFSVKNHLM